MISLKQLSIDLQSMTRTNTMPNAAKTSFVVLYIAMQLKNLYIVCLKECIGKTVGLAQIM